MHNIYIDYDKNMDCDKDKNIQYILDALVH